MKKLLLLIFLTLPLHAEPVTLTVSAAASLQPALESLQPVFEKARPDINLLFNFGASGSLQQQIINGAPVDIFISAAGKQMDQLEKAGLLLPGSRFVLVGNTIVLIAPANSRLPATFDDLRSKAIKKIAIGEPKSVPVGTYASEVLDQLDLTAAVKDKLVFAKDVRQVLGYVGTANADAGIVYGSDVSPAVRVVATAPADSHGTVEYPAAIIKTTKHAPQAEAFLDFLRSPEGSALFNSLGFVTPSVP